MTATTAEIVTAAGKDPLALSGHDYPEGAALVAAETYWYRLARLREAGTRSEAARYTQSLAEAASQVAAALTGHPQAAGDTHTDPLAWTDLATFTGGLATALRGGDADPDRAEDDYDGPYDAWSDAARALNRQEFAAAWYEIGQDLRDRAGLNRSSKDDEDGERRERRDPLRAFAVAQACKAAAAIIDAPW